LVKKIMTMKLDWLRGCATALVTPFKNNGSIDIDCLRKLTNRQIENGVKILVPCGTTGESATMTPEEDWLVISTVIEVAKDRAKVIAGASNNDTALTIRNTQKVRELGADAALIASPYYNKPTQEGLIAHYSAIAEAVEGFPIVLYNVPGRTASNISAATTIRLANLFENIVCTKEASGNFSQIMEIINGKPENFVVFSGDDATTLPLIALGADGVTSVISNEFPREFNDLVEACLSGNQEKAREIHYKFLPLMEANFIESSPAPVKFVMKEMGLLEDKLRLPLVSITEKTKEILLQILAELK
jgi:4-hydroxy-tetrahydrodipicolinate synthase